MRRFLPAALLAVLMAAVASRADAGYLIIRVILEGNGGGAGSPTEYGSTSPMPKMPGGFRPGIGEGQPPAPSGGDPMMPGGTPSTQDPTRSLVVVIPVEEDLTVGGPFYTHLAQHQIANPRWGTKLHLTHRGEKFVTNLFTDSSTVQWYENLKERPAFRRTHTMDVRDQHLKWARTKADPRAGYDVLVAALQIGMVTEAVTYADELLASVKDKKDGLPPEVAGFARAYGAMQKGIKAAAAKRGAGELWQAKLEAPNLNQGPHYTLLYWDASDTEVQRRLAFLEENFKGFFLWHATRGITLPLPETPMVAVLPKQGSDVIRLARVLDAPPRLPADGFYSPGHDVLVLSPDRLDSLGLTFTAQTQQMYQGGVGRSELLAGKGPKIDANGQNGFRKPDTVARMQTLALVERLVEDAAGVCAVSREGSHQLLYATGQLPRYVALPEWLSNGSVNFFTRPKDPAFVQDAEKKWFVHVAPTTGYGGPNYVLHRQFKDVYGGLIEEKRDKRDQKDQAAGRLALLKNTIADAYFLGLRDPKDVNDPDPVKADKSGVALSGGGQPNPGGFFQPGGGMRQPPGGERQPPGGERQPPGGGPWGLDPMGLGLTTPPEEDPLVVLRKKRERLSVKAQASSWALCYYLAKDRPTQFRAFVAELAALPRDLPLDAATMTATFCRAFGLDGSNESLGRFADGWMAYLSTVPSAGVDIPLVDPKPPTTGTGTGTDPGTGPGGERPPGGNPP